MAGTALLSWPEHRAGTCGAREELPPGLLLNYPGKTNKQTLPNFESNPSENTQPRSPEGEQTASAQLSCLISGIYLSFGSSALQDVSLWLRVWWHCGPRCTQGGMRGFKQHSAALALPQMGFFGSQQLQIWASGILFQCLSADHSKARHEANTKQGADSKK